MLPCGDPLILVWRKQDNTEGRLMSGFVIPDFLPLICNFANFSLEND